MKEAKSFCLHCDKLLRGRADKKFCDIDCRNAYHNELSKEDDKEIRRITNIVKKNRKILKTLLGNAKLTKVKKDILMRRGFSFDYLTQVQGGYRFCYEYGYISSPDDYFLIVKGFDKIVSKE